MDVITEWEQMGAHRVLDGRRIFTIDIPSARTADGPPILLLHGFPTCSFDYRHVVEALSERRRVLTLDFLGYGLSEKPDIAYPLGLQADLVCALLEEVGLTGEEIALVTHDMGDSIGGELLARDLDGALPATVVTRVLANGSIFVEHARPRIGQQLLMAIGDRSLNPPIMEALFRKGLPEVFGPDTQPTPEEMDAQWALLSRDGGQRLYPRLIRYYPERKVRQRRWTGAIIEHPSPLTVVWGDQDPVATMRMVDALRAARTDATVHVMDGIGHFPMIEAPQRFAELVLGGV